jgi:hypothetical protein
MVFGDPLLPPTRRRPRKNLVPIAASLWGVTRLRLRSHIGFFHPGGQNVWVGFLKVCEPDLKRQTKGKLRLSTTGLTDQDDVLGYLPLYP